VLFYQLHTAALLSLYLYYTFSAMAKRCAFAKLLPRSR